MKAAEIKALSADQRAKKLAELKEAEDQEKYEKLLAKMQARYDFLISTGNNVSDDQVKALQDLGLKV